MEGALTVARHIPLVLIEGLYLLHKDDGWDVGGLLDECWFLDVPLHTALRAPLQARHMAAWGINAEQAQARIAGGGGRAGMPNWCKVIASVQMHWWGTA